MKKDKLLMKLRNARDELKEIMDDEIILDLEGQFENLEVAYRNVIMAIKVVKEYNCYKIECGKTLKEYMEKFGEAYSRGALWDFSAEDVNGGAIDLNPNQVYWEIDGRLYETKVL